MKSNKYADKSAVSFFDPVFLIRPTLLYPVWIFFLTGVWGAGHLGETTDIYFKSQLYLGMGLTLVMGAVYIFNQIEDRETDRVNNKLFLLSNEIISIRAAYMEAILLVGFGLAIGFHADDRSGVLLILLLLIAGWIYNFRPAAWKNRPVLGLITNGLGGMLIYSIGWKAGGGVGWIPYQSAAYLLAGMAVTLNTTLPDMNGDAQTGKITFGVRYGVKKTSWCALGLEILTFISAILIKDILLIGASLFALPLFIWAVTKPELGHVVRTTKFSVVALAGAVCIVFPWFLLPVTVVFFSTRWYYRARFDFDYPNFRDS